MDLLTTIFSWLLFIVANQCINMNSNRWRCNQLILLVGFASDITAHDTTTSDAVQRSLTIHSVC
jgi:hypothetical protein